MSNCKFILFYSYLPLIAYRRCKNINDILVRVQLINSTDTSNSRPTPGSFRCNNRNCTTCPFIEYGHNQYTSNLISLVKLLIQCRLCNLQYIGETKRHLKDRFNEHRRPILNPTGNYIHTAVSEHFLTSNNSDNHMILIPIEMGVIVSGKHVKPTLSTKLRQLSHWASINVMNCNCI